jgi:hypothetical protein
MVVLCVIERGRDMLTNRGTDYLGSMRVASTGDMNLTCEFLAAYLMRQGWACVRMDRTHTGDTKH